jgi:hypothetical protein
MGIGCSWDLIRSANREGAIYSCIFCKSFNIVKYGVRHNKNQDIQKYNCRHCNHYFTINLGFEKMHATPQMITTAMQLYFTGESFRNVKGSVVNFYTVVKYILLKYTYHFKRKSHSNFKSIILVSLSGSIRKL